MKRLLVSVVAALAMVVAASPVQAASETTRISFRGLSAEAFFISFDPSGCVQNFVFVSAFDGRVKVEPGGPVSESSVFMIVQQFDVCTQTLLKEGVRQVPLGPAGLQIDSKLTAATLDTTLELVDRVSGGSFTVDVNLAWTGTGATATQKEHSHFQAPGIKINERFSGTMRSATATGTVTDGTTDFTPEPAQTARLFSETIGNLEVIHV